MSVSSAVTSMRVMSSPKITSAPSAALVPISSRKKQNNPFNASNHNKFIK